ncbi:MAG: hypothetical protein J7L89_02330 [Bacteroidales bacterium]|nr:hypothetical protein [Bacteroidales bacterium]
MASTLLPGDRVWVLKTRNLHRQDMILYRNPGYHDLSIRKRELMASRLAGLPGDTVIVFNKILFINRDTVYDPPGARHEFRVVTDGNVINSDFLKKYTIQKPKLIADIGIYDLSMPRALSEPLGKTKGIKTVRETRQFIGDSSIDYYPPSPYYMWNRDQFGPLVVPAKGDTIQISIKTVDLYRDIIENFEGNEIEVDFRGVFINGKPAKHYVFKKDYYFILDDNRGRPNDSRVIGFIPQDHLYGRICGVIF